MAIEFQKSASLRRINSVMHKQSSTREEDKSDIIKRQLIAEEEMERGSVSFSVYWTYATSVYKGALAVIIILCQTTFMVSSQYSLVWATNCNSLLFENVVTLDRVDLILTWMSTSAAPSTVEQLLDSMGCTKQRRRAGEGQQYEAYSHLQRIILRKLSVHSNALSTGLFRRSFNCPEILPQHDSVHLSSSNVFL